MTGPPREVRRARRSDLPAVVTLCLAHARYERSPPPDAKLSRRLATALFGKTPKVSAWVAVCGNTVVGYATASPAFSTWHGCDYLHLDCLFVSRAHRGSGAGRQLTAAVISHAQAQEYRWLEWQTPAGNAGAIRFYRRLGARAQRKQRFTLSVQIASRRHPHRHESRSLKL